MAGHESIVKSYKEDMALGAAEMASLPHGSHKNPSKSPSGHQHPSLSTLITLNHSDTSSDPTEPRDTEAVLERMLPETPPPSQLSVHQ